MRCTRQSQYVAWHTTLHNYGVVLYRSNNTFGTFWFGFSRLSIQLCYTTVENSIVHDKCLIVASHWYSQLLTLWLLHVVGANLDAKRRRRSRQRPSSQTNPEELKSRTAGHLQVTLKGLGRFRRNKL